MLDYYPHTVAALHARMDDLENKYEGWQLPTPDDKCLAEYVEELSIDEFNYLLFVHLLGVQELRRKGEKL